MKQMIKPTERDKCRVRYLKRKMEEMHNILSEQDKNMDWDNKTLIRYWDYREKLYEIYLHYGQELFN